MKKTFQITVFIIALLMIGLSSLYAWSNATTFQVAGDIVARVDTSEKVVALTFDDGPTEHVSEVLQLLKEKDIKATFYVVGEEVEKHEDITKNIVEAGHELGNHSYSHQRMIFKPKDFYIEEIEKTNALIRKVGYRHEITFRPPYGKKLVSLPLYLDEIQMKTITWDVEPTKALGNDATPTQIINYVAETTQPGSIILIHPWYGDQNNSRDAIGGVIDALKEQGYSFVTIRQMLEKGT